jgi:pimeloyl-ACP methyl ester carboxylesterase
MTNRRLASLTLLVLAAALPLHTEDLFFNSAGVRIRYTIEGKGEPVVLIHGFGANIEMNWAEPGIFKDLAGNYQVIAMDNRGHGQSGKPHDPRQYGAHMAADVVRLLDHLKIQKAHVVGYSMGGRITTYLVAEHPGRLISATIGGAGWMDQRRIVARRALMRELAESLEQGKGAEPLFRALTPVGQSPPTAAQIAAFSKTFESRNDPLALAAVARGNAGLQPAEAKLRASSVPVLAVVGDLDPVKNETEQLQGVIRNLKLILIPGANHMTVVRNPEFLNNVKSFLAEHRAK